MINVFKVEVTSALDFSEWLGLKQGDGFIQSILYSCLKSHFKFLLHKATPYTYFSHTLSISPVCTYSSHYTIVAF